MISLFKPDKSYIQKLKDKSDSALNIFRRTVADLSSVNVDAEEQIDENTAEVKVLLDENHELTQIIDQNTKVITKIESFLNE